MVCHCAAILASGWAEGARALWEAVEWGPSALEAPHHHRHPTPRRASLAGTRQRRRTRDTMPLGYARQLVDSLNRESLREGWAAWLLIDRRRGWLVIEFYELGGN